MSAMNERREPGSNRWIKLRERRPMPDDYRRGVVFGMWQFQQPDRWSQSVEHYISPGESDDIHSEGWPFTHWQLLRPPQKRACE